MPIGNLTYAKASKSQLATSVSTLWTMFERVDTLYRAVYKDVTVDK